MALYFSDPPINPFKQHVWLLNFKNYILYGELPGGGSAETVPANQVFAGPTSGGAVAPVFRTLVATDIPNLDAAKITTGSFNSARIPTLDASKIGSGVFANARINFAAPAAIGTTTPAAGIFTTTSIASSDGAYTNFIGSMSELNGIRWYEEGAGISSTNLRFALVQESEDIINFKAYSNSGVFQTNLLQIDKSSSVITTTYTWFGTALTLSGNMQSRYGKVTGSGNTYLDINGGNNNDRMLRYYTNNSLRWEIKVNEAESVTDGVGSLLKISGYRNNGSSGFDYITFARGTAGGDITFKQNTKHEQSLEAENGFTARGFTFFETDDILINLPSGSTEGMFSASGLNGWFRTVSAIADDNINSLVPGAITFTNATGTPSNTTTHQGYIKIYIGADAKYIRYYA